MTERKYEASITLTQFGKNGKIEADIALSPSTNNDELPYCHEGMAQLAALWFQIQSTLETTDSTEGEKYTASFVLSQDEHDSPVYSKLELEPRLKITDPTYPTVYEIGCYIAQMWLIMVGVIDEEGNVIEDEALDTVSLKVSSASVH